MIRIEWLSDDGVKLDDTYTRAEEAAVAMEAVEDMARYMNVKPVGWYWDTPEERDAVLKIREGRDFGHRGGTGTGHTEQVTFGKE